MLGLEGPQSLGVEKEQENNASQGPVALNVKHFLLTHIYN